jgi:hypothetical protein
LAPTQGLLFALMNPGKSQLCKNTPCPHGVECIFVHVKGQASTKPGPGGPILQAKDGTSVFVADLAPTQGLAFALMNPGKSQICQNAPCPHGAECNFLHLKAHPGSPAATVKPAPGVQLQDGTSVSVADLAPTQGLAFALMNPGKGQMCKNNPCPHGRECTFLHSEDQTIAEPAPGAALLMLQNGTPVLVADLAPTQGLAFALMNPGKSQMCKSQQSCVHDIACTFLHLRSSAATQVAKHGDRKDLERARGLLWSIRRGITEKFKDGSPSDALVAELVKVYRDIGDRLAAVDRQLQGLSTPNGTSQASNTRDLPAEKKIQ